MEKDEICRDMFLLPKILDRPTFFLSRNVIEREFEGIFLLLNACIEYRSISVFFPFSGNLGEGRYGGGDRTSANLNRKSNTEPSRHVICRNSRDDKSTYVPINDVSKTVSNTFHER